MQSHQAKLPGARKTETIEYGSPERYKVLPEADGTSDAIRKIGRY